MSGNGGSSAYITFCAVLLVQDGNYNGNGLG